MEISHVISDLVLTASGVIAFAASFARAGIRLASLWGVFLVPVTLAAFFGALRFAAVHENMLDYSQFFQVVATTLGSCGLMLGSYGLISKNQLQLWSVSLFLSVGLVLWMMAAFLGVDSVRKLMPLLAMATVTLSGLVALAGTRRRVGFYLLLGVLLSGAAVWAIGSMSNQSLRIDVYHYLLAASLFSFAMAGRAYLHNLQATEP